MPAEPPEGFEGLLAEADRLHEDYDPAGAIRAFRAAALLAPLPDWASTNLGLVEHLEAIEFRRRLVRAFPDSIDTALTEVHALTLAGYRSQAIAQCTDLLGRAGLAEREVSSIRWARLHAAKSGTGLGTYTSALTFVSDFAYFWQREGLGRERVRLSLLRTLAGLDWPEMLDVLTAIRDRFGADADLDRIVASKVAQLKALARLRAALPPIRRRGSGGDPS